ncbi:hypothetical protein IEQ34_022711 [Dendrobium chrysotoxum]|uniref:Uncharacterized protein n=1 Tax=Dendrobium chrysotoxum TaxID=161865 RepID=A0AAV7FYM3_DENCH|nr:hypothetical protein IEQ34_022711 [Dendrobium chrysotoxum]
MIFLINWEEFIDVFRLWFVHLSTLSVDAEDISEISSTESIIDTVQYRLVEGAHLIENDLLATHISCNTLIPINKGNAPTSIAPCHGRRALKMTGAAELFLPLSSHQCSRNSSPLREELCCFLSPASQNEDLFRVY